MERKVLLAHRDLARSSLEDLGYGYSALGDVLETEWNDMGVNRGTRLAILNDRKVRSIFLAMEEVVASRSQAEASDTTRDDSPTILSDIEA